MRNRFGSAGVALVALGCALPPPPAALGQVIYQRVVGRGDPAPGAEAGSSLTFRGFSSPSIGPAGQVAFGGALAGPGVNDWNDAGYWAGRAGSLGMVMREQAAAPGTDATYRPPLPAFGPVPPPVNSSGAVLFFSALTSGRFGDGGIWIGPPGGVELVARTGDPAPATAAGVTYGTGRTGFALNDDGHSAFITSLMGDGVTATNNSAVWSGPAGAVGLAARTGSAAPGAGRATFRTFGVPVLHDSGTVAFYAGLTGPGSTGGNGSGIWIGTSDGLEPAAVTGTPLPGDRTLTAVAEGLVGLDAQGQVGFRAYTSRPDRSPSESLWVGAPGSLSLVAEQGAPAPGTATTFTGFVTGPALNDRGDVAFHAGVAEVVDGRASRGIWAGQPGALRPLVLHGQPAPVGGDVPAHFEYVQSPWLNNTGHVAFYALLKADDGSFESRQSLWVAGPSGQLHLIAHEGGTIDLGGGDVRTITALEVGASFPFEATSTTAGTPLPFNDAAQFAFVAYFPGGDSAIVVATVPEPSATALAALAPVVAAGLLRRRGRRSQRLGTFTRERK